MSVALACTIDDRQPLSVDIPATPAVVDQAPGANAGSDGERGVARTSGDGMLELGGEPEASAPELVPTPGGIEASGLGSAAIEADFGVQEVGVASAPFTWTLVNDGAVPSGPWRPLPLPSGDFVVVANGCERILAPGETCAVTLVYQPAFPGPARQRLTLAGGEQQVSLDLIGVARYRLTIVKAGAGQGRVTGPEGLDCGESCSVLLDPGDVALAAVLTNGSDSLFTGWSASDCTGPIRSCTLSLEGSLSVTATFAVQTNNLVFLGSQNYPPNFGGAQAFDAECNRLASAAGINDSAGTGYVAAVSGPGSFTERMPASARGWVRLDGLPFADQADSLLANPPGVYSSVQFDDTGAVDEDGATWTGLSFVPVLTGTCNDWTTASGSVNGSIGSGRSGPFWLGESSIPCDAAAQLGQRLSMFCLGVTKSAPVAPPSFSGKRMWITTTAYQPGSTTPDAKCNSELPPGVAAARAFIGYTGRRPEEALDPAATYVRPDGQRVGSAAQIAAREMVSAPWQRADGTVWTADIWTGVGGRSFNGSAPVPDAADTCADWTSSDATGSIGRGGYDNDYGVSSGALIPCDLPNFPLFCVEL